MKRVYALGYLATSVATALAMSVPGASAQTRTVQPVLAFPEQGLDDPAAYSVWKERARERVAQKYRWNDVADRYAAVLEGKSVIP